MQAGQQCKQSPEAVRWLELLCFMICHSRAKPVSPAGDPTPGTSRNIRQCAAAVELPALAWAALRDFRGHGVPRTRGRKMFPGSVPLLSALLRTSTFHKPYSAESRSPRVASEYLAYLCVNGLPIVSTVSQPLCCFAKAVQAICCILPANCGQPAINIVCYI